MTGYDLFVVILLGIFVNEISNASPWLARRLIRRAARWWFTTASEAAQYEEEWTALIADRPGKILQLTTAAGFASYALTLLGRRHARRIAALHGRNCNGRALVNGELPGDR